MHRRAPVVIVAFTVFLAMLGSNLPSPLYVIYQQRYHFSALVLTLVFAIYAAAVLLALLVTGRSSDALGRRRVLLPAVGLLTLSTVVFATAHGVAWLFAARLVQGLATGTLTPAATAALVDLDRSEGGSRGSQLSALSFLAGAASGVLLAGALAQYLPYPTVTPFLAELGLDVVGLAGLALLPASALPRGTGRAWKLQRPSVPHEMRQVFGMSAAGVTIAWCVGSVYGSLSPSMVSDVLHMNSHLAAGIVLFLFNAFGGTCQLTLKRADPRQLMRTGIAITVVALAGIEAAFAAGSGVLFLGATIVAGVGQGSCFVGSVTLLNQFAPLARRAEVNTAYSVVAYVALSIPAVGVGLLATSIGLQSAALIFSIAIAAAACGALALLARPLPELVECPAAAAA